METLSNSEWPTLSPAKGGKACKVLSEKNKKCDICSYATAKMSNLKKHMKVHSKVKFLRIGSPSRIMTIRNNSPKSSPRSRLVYM